MEGLKRLLLASFVIFATPLFAGPPNAWTLSPWLADAGPQLPARQQVAVEFQAAALAQQPATLVLPLPGAMLEARLDTVESHAGGRFSWRGHLAEGDQYPVVLSVAGSSLAGFIHTPDGVWEIVPARSEGQSWLIELDAAKLAPEAPPLPVESVEPPLVWPATPIEPLDVAEQTDVLVMYSPAARDAAGGDNQMRAQGQAAVDAANVAFANSAMRTRFRAVGIELLDGWVEGTDSASDELSRFRGNAQQQARRDALKADLVSLLVAELPDGCGIGYVMRSPGAGFAGSAVQLTDRDCAVGNLSWAHEHGHNMGFEHDPANGTAPGNASYPWSFGHYVENVGSNSFRTVMSYACPAGGCTRRAHFSNPGVSFNGYPTGIADQRDNARSGDLTGDIVANFRQGVADGIFCSGFEAGEGGTACLPPPGTQPIQDPSFEATSQDSGPNPYWAASDINHPGATPFYSERPRTGNFGVWAGGWNAAGTQTWSQSVVLASGGPRWLTWWRIVTLAPVGGTATLTVKIDGTTVASFDALANGVDGDWVKHAVDIGAWQDGGSHVILFDYTATGSDDGNVFVDDVTLETSP